MVVRDACDTFVRQYAPVATPTLIHREDGGYELLVSLTPAATAEALAVRDAARRGPVDIMVYPSERHARVLRVDDGSVVVAVNSPEHAEAVAEVLCLDPVAAPAR